MTVDIAVPGGAILGECPIWSPADERLYWIDIEGRAVHRFDPATGHDELKPMDVRPGSMVLTDTPGRFLMGAENELGWYDWSEGSFSPLEELEPGDTGNRLNDGRTDRQGRYWVGSMYHRSSARISSGLLHRIDADLAHVTVRSEIGVSNGIAFSPDGTTMYFADTFEKTIWQYDYDGDSGDRSNERVFSDFSGVPGKPDGAAVDEEGCYWIACVTGWAVARLTPGGAVDRVIEVPAEKPSMPAFAGPGLDRLFVTSISEQTTPGSEQPHAGALFAIDPGVRGIPETPFAG